MRVWFDFSGHIMRPTLLLASAACAIACSGASPTTNFDRLPPPVPLVTASTRVDSSGGIAHLEVSAFVSNPTTVHFRLSTGPLCPEVRIFPDPTGEVQVSSGPVTTCLVSQSTVDLAPGDSITLKRVMPPEILASFPAGLYGVNVQVVTDRVVIGLWAGTVRLPLMQGP